MPMLIFGSFSIAAALLTLLLPETLGKLLPDTLDDVTEQRDEDSIQEDPDPGPDISTVDIKYPGTETKVWNPSATFSYGPHF